MRLPRQSMTGCGQLGELIGRLCGARWSVTKCLGRKARTPELSHRPSDMDQPASNGITQPQIPVGSSELVRRWRKMSETMDEGAKYMEFAKFPEGAARAIGSAETYTRCADELEFISSGGNLENAHVCRRCGKPGAVIHYPGGYLCPDGCKSPNIRI